MSVPALYLDFDVVLHPDAVYRERARIVLRRDGFRLFEWAHLLEEILEGFPKIQIILSTSWVPVLSYAVAKSHLPPGIQRRVIGSTFAPDIIDHDILQQLT